MLAPTMMKTSISLPDDLAAALARLGPDPRRRSAIVTRALRAFLVPGKGSGNDSAILDAHAIDLNEEAQEVLEFQKIP